MSERLRRGIRLRILLDGYLCQIMTGAAVPAGADAVVMIEFTSRTGELVTFQKETKPDKISCRKAVRRTQGISSYEPVNDWDLPN